MTYFTNLPAMARYIRRTHCLFGLYPAEYALHVLGDANASMAANKAVCAVTFEALQRIPDFGYLRTYCTIGRDKRGAWYLSESTQAPA